MRTTSRLAASAAVLGGALLFAAPATAQTAPTPCAYPFIDCPTTPAPSPSNSPGGGGGGDVETSAPSDSAGGGGGDVETSAPSDSAGGGGGDVETAAGSTTQIGGGSGGAAVNNRSNLPFTGGEITLLALAGTAALGGGAALVVAGRRRQSA